MGCRIRTCREIRWAADIGSDTRTVDALCAEEARNNKREQELFMDSLGSERYGVLIRRTDDTCQQTVGKRASFVYDSFVEQVMG